MVQFLVYKNWNFIPDFGHQSKSPPFNNSTHFYRLNTGLIRNSNPLCFLKIFEIKKNSLIPSLRDCLAHFQSTYPFMIVVGFLVRQRRRKETLSLTESRQPRGIHYRHPPHVHLVRLKNLLVSNPFCKKLGRH